VGNWPAAHKTFRVCLIPAGQRLLTCNRQFLISTGKHLFRREPGQTAVMVLEVVPVDIALEPLTGMTDTFKAARIVRLILGRFELTFAEWIIVTDPGAAMAAGHELVLSRDVANQRIFPALDISKSSTRREELLLDPKDLDKIIALRRALGGLKPLEGTKKLVELLEKYPTNAELLKNIPGPG
jgi:hypothetical protein